MSVPPPYDRLASVPVLVANKVVPILTDLISKLSLQTNSINTLLDNIPTNVSCNDVEARELRGELTKLLNILDRFDPLINIIKTILDILEIAATIAISVASAINIVPVPPGALVTAARASGLAGTNGKTVIQIIRIIIQQFLDIVKNILPTISSADNFFNTLCNENNDNVSSVISALGNNENINIDVSTADFISVQDLLDEYPSTFYTELNVSDTDLNNRYQEIVELIDGGFDVLNNLNEFPSQVIRNQGPPTNNIGNSGDFYIDTQTNQLFGPKPTNNSWI